MSIFSVKDTSASTTKFPTAHINGTPNKFLVDTGTSMKTPFMASSKQRFSLKTLDSNLLHTLWTPLSLVSYIRLQNLLSTNTAQSHTFYILVLLSLQCIKLDVEVKIKQEEQLDIIEKVTGLILWGSTVVVVLKKTG